MKHRSIYIAFLSLLFMAVFQNAMGQDALFDKYENTNGVTTVFISKKIYKSEGYEAIMRMNDEGEKMTIYQRSLRGGKNEFVLLQEERSDLNIINVKGSITLKDIQMIAGH